MRDGAPFMVGKMYTRCGIGCREERASAQHRAIISFCRQAALSEMTTSNSLLWHRDDALAQIEFGFHRS